MTLESMSLAEQRAESALAFVVPEVVDVVGPIRRQYIEEGDRTPPHITLFHPFFASSEVTPALLQHLADIFAAVPSFEYRVTGLATFPPNVVYLTLEPTAPFVDLITRLRIEFPDVAPYWDEYDEVVPHITVAVLALTEDRDVRAELDAQITAHLPIRGVAREIQLFQRLRPPPAPWDLRATFPLGDRA